ncbi:DnaB-like helicase C-terminal domain-containing protein [Spirosoma flavum]|uniref:DnaB-like helicase C-terminal domain-containing protein n=1 Tax=Spirosoma flavum TaxID=2048557 RepID=A0ABW6ATS5_9BACT
MASKRKLQVFVSSTYTDLIKERQAAVEAILTAGHIPAGMELFSAGDKSQMDVIKRWIDESDAYLLILAGRYGSIDPELDKSYTQLEYEYALEKSKAFFALVITEKRLDEKVRSEGKGILELDNPQKLKDFKALVETKIVKFWDDERDIKLAILQTLPEFERRPELIGWVPGNEATASNMVAKEIARLAEENSALKARESFNVSVKKALERLEGRTFSEGLTGVPSMLIEIDRLTSGWQPSELIIIAARPAMGKTSLAISALLNAAIHFGTPVAIFTMELSKEQLVDRLIASETEIDSDKIRKANLAPYEWVQVSNKSQQLMEAPIYIEDTSSPSISEICARCRQLKAQHDIQMVVIDYLQLITDDDSKGINREEEITSISRTLKNLAKELNIPVLVLSQLGREVETRGGDKRPQLSDLRNLGSIEANADVVMFLYRPEYYNIIQDDNGNSTAGVAELIVVKNRSGSLGTIQLRFIGRYTKFVDLESYNVSNSSSFDSVFKSTKSSTSRASRFSGLGSADPSDEPPF